MIGYLILYIPVLGLLFYIKKYRIDTNCQSAINDKNGFAIKKPKFAIKKSQLIYWIIYNIMLFWGGLRGNISDDIQNTYLKEFNYIKTYGVSQHYDTLFEKLNKFIINSGGTFQVFLFVTTLIYVTCVFYSIKKLSEYPAASLLLFIIFDFYYGGLNQIRQYLGMAIFCLSLCKSREDKKKISIILAIIAGLIHSSCFFLLITFLFERIDLKPRNIVFFLAFSPFLLIVGEKVISYIFLNFNGGQYAIYIFQPHEVSFLGKVLIPFIKAWGMMFLYILCYKEVSTIEGSNLYINMQLAACLLSVMGFYSSEMVRMVNMFLFYQILFIPKIIKCIPKGTLKHFYALGYFGFITAYFLFTTYQHIIDYPYECLTYVL